MAENDKKTDESTESGSKQTQLLLMIILGASLAVPLLSASVTVKMVNAKIDALKAKPAEGLQENGEEKKAPIPMAFYSPLEFLVNLADTEENHYLRATISLALPGEAGGGGGGEHGKEMPKALEGLKVQEPVIRDTIIAVISSRTLKELATPAGKDALKDTIRKRLQEQLALEGLAVYFTSFTLQ